MSSSDATVWENVGDQAVGTVTVVCVFSYSMYGAIARIPELLLTDGTSLSHHQSKVFEKDSLGVEFLG